MLDPIEAELMLMLAKLQERMKEQAWLLQRIAHTTEMIAQALAAIEKKLP